MLKLTRLHVLSGETALIYITASQIIALCFSAKSTSVYCPSHTFEVTETPEEIMAIPEMMRAMNPLVSFYPVGDWGNEPGRSILSTNR